MDEGDGDAREAFVLEVCQAIFALERANGNAFSYAKIECIRKRAVSFPPVSFDFSRK